MSDDKDPSIRIPLSIDIVWKVVGVVVLVVGQYYALKGQLTDSVNGLDKRLILLEAAKTSQEATENARHAEITARLTGLDAQLQHTTASIQSIDNFTQSTQADLRRLTAQFDQPPSPARRR